MSSLISRRRARRIIAAYGADSKRWPQAYRESMRLALERYPELLTELEQAASLDAKLIVATPVSELSIEQLVNTVTATPQGGAPQVGLLEQLLDAIQPSTHPWWRTAVLAAIPLCIGLYLGALDTSDGIDWSSSEQYVFAQLPGENVDG